MISEIAVETRVFLEKVVRWKLNTVSFRYRPKQLPSGIRHMMEAESTDEGGSGMIKTRPAHWSFHTLYEKQQRKLILHFPHSIDILRYNNGFRATFFKFVRERRPPTIKLTKPVAYSGILMVFYPQKWN
ncbi:hypothetical protein EVAR_89692_1 [Eumeta japonica]|uniref:Uncharacterized protein n=1 Tax=Eumeta variegata TaxID=151549 RepID=A0A4C1WWP9_EUMVA|nr:hypothetical protein EVAR_89692_1 [Eumeta japonica]